MRAQRKYQYKYKVIYWQRERRRRRRRGRRRRGRKGRFLAGQTKDLGNELAFTSSKLAPLNKLLIYCHHKAQNTHTHTLQTARFTKNGRDHKIYVFISSYKYPVYYPSSAIDGSVKYF